jgi:hypothetical protein
MNARTVSDAGADARSAVAQLPAGHPLRAVLLEGIEDVDACADWTLDLAALAGLDALRDVAIAAGQSTK